VPRGAVGCFPGSFNPPTLAHLAIARAALEACGLERVELVVSRVALAKEHVVRPPFEDRVRVLRAVVAARRPWLGLSVTDAQLLADLAAGYDVLVLGADKWDQVLDPRFYGGSSAARDEAVGRLPPLAVVPRPGHEHVELPPGAVVLELPPDLAPASSTAARRGRIEWMAPEAAASGLWATGVSPRYATPPGPEPGR
jgi:nicotinamide-nucleotide adenylyltransferase